MSDFICQGCGERFSDDEQVPYKWCHECNMDAHDWQAENAALKAAGDALAEAVDDFDDWADSTQYNPSSPFGLKLIGLRLHIKNWLEVRGD